ncbi:GIY-YIG nuclease family protein [Candidatus Peregrinibacteria bacterium]|jgi:putative endonuclease|nr:GIY-YIG nuclease family protein [Candidatus Peregrinibacteria bacterium]MBT4631711.1 GIY-YIG nuclease family protein [Candidatus Peregrinibacteria bacterium]MBT5516565.1 GIY-YIG nuclease family protein [Candidatus Peregrinibacteria bacterium]MBT5824557.1 GIY-YIG nuclease family protein [Candidatus Peregrinibacteria bacterium]
MYTVYVLESLKDQKRYVGMTSNLDRRLKEHYRGGVKSTRSRRPFKLVHKESFAEKKDAGLREKFFKTGKGRDYLDSL